MSVITSIHGRQILDSRGNPTVEVDVVLEGGARGTAAVPSGASTGQWEAVELRDGGDAWMGKGVTQAVAHVNGEIATKLKGMEAGDQRAIDSALTVGEVLGDHQHDAVHRNGPERSPFQKLMENLFRPTLGDVDPVPQRFQHALRLRVVRPVVAAHIMRAQGFDAGNADGLSAALRIFGAMVGMQPVR